MSSTTDSDSSTECKQRPSEWIDDGLDRSPASVSPFSRPNENSETKIRGREYDQGTTDGRGLETRVSPKRGEISGRCLGGQISKSDCDSPRWERLRKRDEEILTFDSDRYEREGDAYLSCHRGGGVETNGDDRIRAMTLMAVVSNVAGELNADSAVENHARTLVAGLDESETNGRAFEATATSALVVARDDFVANQILRINSRNDEIQAIQRALERSQSPAERFRVLNNLCHVTEDERIQRLLQRRLRDVAEDYAERRAEGEVVKIVDGKIEIVSPRKFVLETVIENVSWSA